jgi:hypothetical protein
MDKERLRRIVRQHAETSRLMGVDFVYVKPRTCAEAEQRASDPVDIGRGGVFGNPFRAAPDQKFEGSTLEPYKKWLFAAIKQEEWSRKQYRDALGRELPADFARQVQELVDLPFHCPGCLSRTEEDGVCHGSILRRAAVWLNDEGARYAK